ncbi:TPA: hypothetical protein N0F65_009079 [Lagenidium giganteum]|uniref:NADPH:adrenodoxin oxidoreductase, mitochondrial n=1 Tax=Lagenidium giganteum TaxID=4803 RepID=A0AAV2YRP3_9STRA|nr:TPA: hypothetical protein N0F65_009079 [Lagenidium giganteum]
MLGLRLTTRAWRAARTTAMRAPWSARCAMSSNAGAEALRVCIVGSGPGGFYAAKYLLKEHPNAQVNMLEMLPTPFGLVRAGVAPDHPEVKSVISDFEKVAAEERFAFLGNVTLGRDVHMDELKERYNAVVLAYGAAGDRTLGVPGEQLGNVHSARAFVNWYNGHPSFRDLEPDLSGDTAVIFGQGNVAVDCARILTKSTDELATTDIAKHALDALRNSNVKNVYLVGRRGTAQAAFTMKELREITKLDGVSCVVNPEDIKQSTTESSVKELGEHRAKKRIHELLTKIAANYDEASTAERQIKIKFLASPAELLPSDSNPECVGAARVEKTRLEGEANHQKAVGTGEFEEIPCGLVLRSIGYKSHAIEGVPFDMKRHVVSNQGGRAIDPASGEQVVGVYCTGWLKRGPTGIIGSNIIDARETVSCLVEDAHKNNLITPSISSGLEGLAELIKSRDPTKQLVQWEDVTKLHAEEFRRGESDNKPREKVTSVKEMLQIITR